MANRWTVYDSSSEHQGMNFRRFPSTSGVYQIVNTVNQKRYIGYATNLRRRCKCHRVELRVGNHKNPHLQNAWNSYKEYSFEFSVMNLCDTSWLRFWEDYWCKVLKSHDREFGYNIQLTDPNGEYSCSEETKQKIGLANKGKKHFGQDNPFYGRKHSPETIAINRQKGKERDHSADCYKKGSKRVFDLYNGIFYPSVVALSKATNIPLHKLSDRLSGRVKNNTPYIYR